MKLEVVLKDMGVGENDAKTRVVQKYSPTCPKTKLWSKYSWIRRSWTREKGLNSN